MHFSARSLHLWSMGFRTVIALIFVAAVAVAWLSQKRIETFERRIRSVEEALAKMDERAFVLSGGRAVVQRRDETREDWAVRVASIYQGAEQMDGPGWQCTELSGCNTPTGTVMVCTPPGGDHQADIDAICTALRCTNCPPASPR